MILGSMYRRFRGLRPLALIGSGGLLLGALPSCEAEGLTSVWVDAIEGAINAAIPTLFEAIREDVGGETVDTIPTVLLNTVHGLTTMLA